MAECDTHGIRVLGEGSMDCISCLDSFVGADQESRESTLSSLSHDSGSHLPELGPKFSQYTNRGCAGTGISKRQTSLSKDFDLSTSFILFTSTPTLHILDT